MRAAFEGVETVFLIPAGESADRVEQHKTAVDAAVAAGVARIVYLSFFNAAPDATFTLARDHWATEEHIRASGVAWTFLRMNLYMDFIPGMAVDGVIRGPAGDGRVSAILRDDVAAAAVAVLRAPRDGETSTSPARPRSRWPRSPTCWAPSTSTRPTRRRSPHAPRTARPTGRSPAGSRPTRPSATGPSRRVRRRARVDGRAATALASFCAAESGIEEGERCAVAPAESDCRFRQ